MLTISQFSKLGQITSKTLRYYDDIDLLKPTRVDQENGYRYYTSQQLVTVRFIQHLKAYECTLDEIKSVLNDGRNLKELLLSKQERIEQKIANYTSLSFSLEVDIAALAEGGNFMLTYEESSIEVVTNPEWSLLSIRKTINIKDYQQLMTELFSMLDTKKVTPTGPPLTFYHSPEFTPENYDVEIAIPIAEAPQATRQLSPEKHVVCHFTGNYEQIPTIYSHVAQWMTDNHYDLSGAPFEVYLSDPATTPADQNKVDVYLPIVHSTKVGESHR